MATPSILLSSPSLTATPHGFTRAAHKYPNSLSYQLIPPHTPQPYKPTLSHLPFMMKNAGNLRKDQSLTITLLRNRIVRPKAVQQEFIWCMKTKMPWENNVISTALCGQILILLCQGHRVCLSRHSKKERLLLRYSPRRWYL